MEACQDGQEEALHKWFAEAGPVFGFTAMAGDGYRIEAKHCDPVVGGSFGCTGLTPGQPADLTAQL
jgi:hypothetical protein